MSGTGSLFPWKMQVSSETGDDLTKGPDSAGLVYIESYIILRAWESGWMRYTESNVWVSINPWMRSHRNGDKKIVMEKKNKMPLYVSILK